MAQTGKTADLFRSRLDGMIDIRHPLAVLGTRLPWAALEASFEALSQRSMRPERLLDGGSLLLASGVEAPATPGGVLIDAAPSAAGRPKLPTRLLICLLYLKHTYDLSDEELCDRWSENVVWQFFSGLEHYEPRRPCDPTQIVRFRSAIGEAGHEIMLKATIEAALAMKAIKPVEFETIIVDTTVQEKAIAHPTDTRLLEVARAKVVDAAKKQGIHLRQSFAKEAKVLVRKGCGYAHAKQTKRVHKVNKRQRTIVKKLVRDVRKKTQDSLIDAALETTLQRALRLAHQEINSKNKLYAFHAPEVECINKGKARRPYEFGVKVGISITHKQGLIVGAKSFVGRPYDGHTLKEQLAQCTGLIEASGRQVKQVVVDLGYRGKAIDAENAPVHITHRGRYKRMGKAERKKLKRRSAVEPSIGHLKEDHRMGRCRLKGALGDAMHVLACAAGYNIRWLMRAILRLGLKRLGFFALANLQMILWVAVAIRSVTGPGPGWSAGVAKK